MKKRCCWCYFVS